MFVNFFQIINFLIFKSYFIFTYVWVRMCGCMGLVCAWEYWCPKGPEAADPLGAGVTGADEPDA